MELINYYKNKGYLRPAQIYIHIPFCEKKCNYCDFLSYDDKEIFFDKYFNSLYAELMYKSKYISSYDICTVYIGGGTPTCVSEKYIIDLLNLLKNNFNIIEDAEISIECNPHSAIKEKLLSYKENGINRLSVGLQSANNEELQELGRIHTYEDFLLTVQEILKLNFKNYNIDLMNGIPNQTIKSWKHTLKSVLNYKPTHISAYNLILEKNTILYNKYKNNELKLPTEDEILIMDLDTESILQSAGYYKYEISNYAKNSYECLHNLGYWSDIPYLGLGLGASSYIGNKRYKNISSLLKYIEINYSNTEIYENEIFDEIKILNDKQLMDEYIMLNLRKINGVNNSLFKNKFGKNIRDVYQYPLDKYLTNSLILHENDNYKFSKRGMNISNTILSDLLFNS